MKTVKGWRGVVLGMCVMLLAGCANMQAYYHAVDAANARQVEAMRERAKADAVRYQALQYIAESGGETAKVAAAMALVQQGAGAYNPPPITPAVPQNEALQWASVLVPGFTQAASIYYGAKQNMNASDNATKLGINTNSTFAQFASEINNPTVVTQPAPVIVTQPDPVVVTQPAPIIVPPTVVNPVVIQPAP